MVTTILAAIPICLDQAMIHIGCFSFLVFGFAGGRQGDRDLSVHDHVENAFIVQYIAVNTGEFGDFSFSIDHLKPDDWRGRWSPKWISNIAAVDNRVMVFGVSKECFVYYPDSEQLIFIEVDNF